MDDEERRLSILSLQFWRVGSAIIRYFYNFSYLYMPFYQFYTFSTAFMFESKSARIALGSTGKSRTYPFERARVEFHENHQLSERWA